MAQALQRKTVAEIVQNRTLPQLCERDARIANRQARLGGELFGQLPCARQQFFARQYFTDDPEGLRLARRQFLPGEKEVAAAIYAQHERPYYVNAVTGHETSKKMRRILEFRVLCRKHYIRE